MGYLLYNLLLLLASPAIVLTLLAKKRCRRGLLERLGLSGLLRPSGPNGLHRPLIWVHAVSLGEVVAVVPLVRALHARHPKYRMLVSTVTETGREAVEQRLSGIAEHCYAPLDFPWAVSRAIARLRPSLFLFVETELWPNLLRALAGRGVSAVLVNGRLSSRSFRRYRMVRPFMRRVLGGVTRCLMQSDRDVERIVELGARPDRVFRAGNIKFDQPFPETRTGPPPLSRELLGVTDGEDLLVAGSTHPGEEGELLAGYRALLREFKSLVLLMAPRHIERGEEVVKTVQGCGLRSVRRSELKGAEGKPVAAEGPRVVILDTRGELLWAYRHAVLAFVGGTLVPVGGHNLLEPALWGKPVLFGPHTDHCAESAELLLRAGGARRVRDGEELAREVGRLLRDREALEKAGQAAKTVVEDNRGAVQRCLDHIHPLLAEIETAGPQTRPVSRTLPPVEGQAVKGER